MRCEAVRDALPELARGTLPQAEADTVRAHLAACDECADVWAVIGALAEARVSAPAGLADRVSAELAQRAARGLGARRGVARPVRWLAGAGLAAAAVFALLLAWPEAPDDARTIELASANVAARDPFLDAELFGATTPTEAELDGMIRVAAQTQTEVLASLTPEPVSSDDELVAPLALDVGSPLGDWPGADGMSAGEMMIDELTYEEMELLLTEMES